MLTYLYVHLIRETQVSRLGTESFISYETQKFAEGTALKPPTTIRRIQMAKVTYRGVEYDTEEYNAKVLEEAAQRQRHELMYRGLKVNSKASPCS